MRRTLLYLVALATAGCVMSSGTTVHWDLSHGHGASTVGLASSGDVVNEEDVADLTIQLPGDHTFHAQNVKVTPRSVEGQVQSIDVAYPKTTLDAGYEQAQAFAKQWNLRTENLNAWHQQVVAGRAQGVKDSDEPYSIAIVGQDLAPDGPTLDAMILYSFDESKPFILQATLSWAPPS